MLLEAEEARESFSQYKQIFLAVALPQNPVGTVAAKNGLPTTSESSIRGLADSSKISRPFTRMSCIATSSVQSEELFTSGFIAGSSLVEKSLRLDGSIGSFRKTTDACS